MNFPSKEIVESRRRAYTGKRIKLVIMKDPYGPMPSGSLGTVDFVDDIGQLHMKWDNGRTLAVIPGQDRFELVS